MYQFKNRPLFIKALLAVIVLFTLVTGLQANLSAAPSSKVYFLDDVVKIEGNYALDGSGMLWELDVKLYTAEAVIDQVKVFSGNGSVIRADGSVWIRSGSAYVQVEGLPAATDVEGNYVIDTRGNVWSITEKKQQRELKNIVKLDDGEYDAALDKDGNVWIWGYDPHAWKTDNPNESFGPALFLKNIRHLQGGIAIDNNWKIINIWREIYLNYASPGMVHGTNIDLSAFSDRIKDVFVHSVSDVMSHSYVLLDDGTLWTWEEDETGGLQQVKWISNVIAVAGTESSGIALFKSGYVSSWSVPSLTVDSRNQKPDRYTVTPLIITTPHIGIRLNGELKALPSPPIMHNNRVYTPVRGLFESLGGTVNYENDIVKVSYNNHQVEMKVWSAEALIDGRKVTLDAPAQIMSGKTMVPVRFISQSLGAEVKWDAFNRIVELTFAEK